MSIILGPSILICLAALAWSVWLWHRVRDGRMAFLSLMLALIAVWQILTLWASGWSGGLSFEGLGTEWPGLLVSVMAFVAVIALDRLLMEHREIETDQKVRLARQQEDHAEATAFWKNTTQVLEQITDGFFAVDAAWRFVYVNQHAAAMLGQPSKDLPGKHLWTEYPATEDHSFYKATHEALARQEHIQLETHYEPWEQWFEVQIYPTPEGLSVFFHDITERKKTLHEMELLAQSVRSTSDIVCISDQEDRIVFVNRALLDTYGYQREELIGRPVTMLRHPDLPPAEDPLTLSYEERENWQGEFWNAAKDGTPILLALSSTTVRDDAGEAVAYVGVAKDITQQRAAETALALSESRLAEAQQIAQLGSYEVDLHTDTPLWSDTMYSIFGIDPEEQHGNMTEMVARLIHPDDMDLSQEAIRRRIETRKPVDSTYRIIRPDGEVRTIHTRGRCIYDAVGEPVVLKGTVQDVTEMKAVEDAIRKQEAWLSNAEKLGQLGSWEWIQETDTHYWSPTLEALYGEPLDPKGTAEEQLKRLIHPDDWDRVKYMPQHLQDPEAPDEWQQEYRMVRPDGHILHCLGHAAVERDSDGSVRRLYGTVQDVSDFRKAVEAAQEAEEQLQVTLASARVATWRWDVPAESVAWSGNIEEVLGLAPGTFGRTYEAYLELMHPEDREQVKKAVEQAIKEDTFFDVERRLLLPDGSLEWIEQKGQVFRNESGEVSRVIGVVTNITDRKEAAAALERNEALLRESQRIAHVGSYEITFPAQTLYFTDEMCRIYGFDSDELPDNAETVVENIVHPDDRVRIQEKMMQGLKEGGVREIEYRIIRPDGIVRHLIGRSQYILNADGTPQRIIGSAYDITEYKLAEAKNRELDRRFQSIFNSTFQFIGLLALDGTLLEANEAGGSVGNRSPDKALGKKLWDTDWFNYDEAVQQQLQEAVQQAATGKFIRYEVDVSGLEGQVITVDFSLKPLYDDEGAVQFLLPEGRDITALRQSTNALQRTARRLEGLHAIDQALLRAQTPEAIARLALPHLRDLVPAERVSVALFDEDEKNAVILAIDAAPGFESQFGIGTIVPADVFKNLLPDSPYELIYDADLASAHEHTSIVAFMQEGWQSSVRVPLHQQDQVIGALNVASQQIDAFNEEHLAIVREVADQLSITLYGARLLEETVASRERLRQLSRKLVEVQEAERRHLALELHDEIGQMLTVLKLSMNLPEEDHTPASRAACDKAGQVVNLLTQRVRNLSLELRPSMLDDLGLLPALFWHVRRFTEQTQITVDFSHAGLDQQRFESMTETTAYRIVQEALTNVARHAGVDTVSVSVRIEDAILVMEIEDKGAGFDPKMLKLSGHTAGLSGMAERAELAGGKLFYTTAPGEGVSINVVLPAFATVAVV